MNNYTSSLPEIKILTYRGIKCISTIPLELIWGKKGTCLECNICLKNAIDPKSKILIGLCYICAEYYDYKYGCGYFENLDGYEDIPTAFGGLDTNYVIDKVHIITNNKLGQYQIANNVEHIWSIYDMVIRLSKNDINLLTKKNNYGWQDFYKNYENNRGYDLEIDLDAILNTVQYLQNLYNIIDSEGEIIHETIDLLLFNKEFYNYCFEIQLNYPEKLNLDIDDNIQSSKLFRYNCEYCNTYKSKSKLKKCSTCQCVRYCSIACQTRDWNLKHKNICPIISHEYQNSQNGQADQNDQNDQNIEDVD
jgi:hypothetical protein